MFAMPSQLGSRGDAAGSLNATNLITARFACGFWLLTANLAVLTAFGKLHDVSRDHPLVASLIGSSPWLAVICKCQIKSEDVKKPKKKFALATRIEDVEI